MAKTSGWTTISIPTTLYREIQEFHVKKDGTGVSTSVQDFVRFWARAGSLVDRALAAQPDAAALAALLAKMAKDARQEGRAKR